MDIAGRPRPRASMLDPEALLDSKSFIPALELIDWARATFIEEGAVLENPDHAHLRHAKIAALWTLTPNSRGGRTIIGQAEFGQNIGGMGKWQKARAEQQILEWFGFWPDFLLTFFAPYAADCSDATWCALVEHELSHCGQAKDEYGLPRFSKSTGGPVFCMRGHDVEEFVGVVRRYGADAAGVRAMVDAAAEGPTVAVADVGFACGNCQR
jgi:hypothetical protein